MKVKKDTTVFVGVSGGVDSSVAAFLLKREGYKVVGAFIKTWQPNFIECTWRQERRDAMRVCAQLEIPFITIDAEKEYKEKVGEYMIEEYQQGRTPNPDVMCNKEVKFGIFLKKSLELGADFVATGHYAQRREGEKSIQLLRGVDSIKDQTYFLWTLSQEQLKYVLFPVGGFPKAKVREIAKKIGLFTARKKDSQGVCFLGEIDMKNFLSHYIQKKEGSVLNMQGETIGSHYGALFFTYGERHGFHINKKGPQDKPLYVVAKDIEKNTITVSEDISDRERFVDAQKITIAQTVWNHPIKNGGQYTAVIRYNQEPQNCTVFYEQDKLVFVIEFSEPQHSFSPGQSVVVYDGEVCLGGGVII
jgi:tRNA-specific 2-thiouridylase